MKIKALRRKMAEMNISAALIWMQENVQYFSGFDGDSSQLLITPTEKLFFTDFRYTEHAEDQTDFRVIETGGPERLEKIFSYVTGNVGIDLAGVKYPEYKAFLGQIAAEGIVDLSEEVDALRIVKDGAELDAIRKGAEHNDMVFDHLCKIIKPGMSENDIKSEIIYFMNRHGADIAFAPIVASGENSSLPHAVPSDRKIQAGDFVTMDLGHKFDGYCSDFTRTVGISDIDKTQQKVYDIVNCAAKMAREAVRPGIKACEVDAVARGYIADNGYGEAFGHGLGHGVGLMIHEAPTVNAKSTAVLEEGMVITIEPGIYLKGRYGVRIEDLCVVTKDGCETLSRAPRELIIL